MAFTQTMTVTTQSSDGLVDLMESWHRDQKGAAPGHEGARPDYHDHEVAYRSG